jgi:hypothetical protein
MTFGFLLCWFKEKPQFDPDIPMLRDCELCKHCVIRGMCNRMTVHLIEDHKLEDEHAYSTVNWVFEKVRQYRRKTAQ